MLSMNRNMKFLLITDDVQCKWLYTFPYKQHVDVGFDYYVVNQAKWLIISNSTFDGGQLGWTRMK
jgi:hypothetical protein